MYLYTIFDAYHFSLWMSRVKRALCLSLVLTGIAAFGQVKLGDLDGDNQKDLLYRHEDGRFACSFDTTEQELLSSRLVSGFEKDPTWHVASLADLDADGKTDLLLRHPDGMWEYVPMDGCTPKEDDRADISSLAELQWRIVLAADVDDDGHDELFWRDDAGRWTIRYMDGANVQTTIHDPEGLPSGSDWYTVGSGDVDSDGKIDIVIRHRDGTWQRVWPAGEGGSAFSSESLPFELDPSWREEGIADFDGDGKADLLLRHARGHWKVQSLASNEDGPIVEWDVQTLPTTWDWRIKALGDTNQDGEDELLMLGPQNEWNVTSVGRESSEAESVQIGKDPNLDWLMPNPPVYIPDTTLRQSIGSALETGDEAWFYPKDMRRLDRLSNEVLSGPDIGDLRGLRYAYRLTTLNLPDEKIVNLSPLIGLVQLSGLTLNRNAVEDVSPLSGLPILTFLRLDNNEISDISPLSSLTKLVFLNLSRNRIESVAGIGVLSNLASLFLSSNQISDISPLKGLINLKHLLLGSNRISNIPSLTDLTELTTLNINRNELKSIRNIGQFSSLISLYLYQNQISDISGIEDLASLRFLELGSNQISNVESLSTLGELVELRLDANQISDISPLERLTNLSTLTMRWNRISDIRSLSSLDELSYLNLANNQISDISPLEGLTSLVTLILSSNQISDIDPLSVLLTIESLDLRNNPLTEEAVATLDILSEQGADISAGINGSFTDSRSATAKFGYSYHGASSEPVGVLVYFHGNTPGTASRMIRLFLSSISSLAARHGLVGVVVASPQSGNYTVPWRYPENDGEGVRFYNYIEDVDMVHEMLQTNFGGSINIDPSQIFLSGASQGTCFLNRFISKWGEHYGGGLLANCGCSEGLDPLMTSDQSSSERFRIFVRASTGDFLHNLSRQAYGYYKYVVGFETRGDLNRQGGHCGRGDVSDDEALRWLREGGSSNETTTEAHVTRVSLFDRIVGLATDPEGGVWISQQISGEEPQATLWRSVDRGVSFEFIGNIQDEIYDLDIVEDRLFVTAPGRSILRSDDSGRTFSPIDLQWSTANGLISRDSTNKALGRMHTWKTPVLTSTREGDLLVLPKADDEPRIYVSTDLANSWSEKTAPETNWRGISPDPVNLLSDGWYLTVGQPPSWVSEDDSFVWQRLTSPMSRNSTYLLGSYAWSGTALLGLTPGYGRLWSSTDGGNRWESKPMPTSANISFGGIRSAELTAMAHGDVLLVGGGRDAQLYNGHRDEWRHVYGAAGIGITPGDVRLSHKVAIDPVRRDIYITDSRGLFRIDGRFRPNGLEVPVFDDSDDDGIPDSIDQFPDDPLEYLDTDLDEIGNAEDLDDDGDGTEDALDGSPLDPLETSDLDHDGIGDRHDNDKDGDRVNDVLDQFPLNGSESLDTDDDGIGNWEDLDDDNDGVEDLVDAFPLYADESIDTDGDFIGDNIDPDPTLSTFTSDSHLSPAIGPWLPIEATSISMNSTKPADLIAPDFASGKPLYGSISLGDAGNTSKQLMLLIFEGTETPVLYLDRNSDNNLTNDGPALHIVSPENRIRELWYRSWVEVSYQSGITLPYYLYISVALNHNGESADLTVGASGRVLSKTLPDDEVMNLVVVDGNGDGVFDGTDDFFCVDLDFNVRLTNCDDEEDESSDIERFQIGESFTLGSTTYTPQVAPSGYTIEFETEENAASTFQSRAVHRRAIGPSSEESTLLELTEITEESFYEPHTDH